MRPLLSRLTYAKAASHGHLPGRNRTRTWTGVLAALVFLLPLPAAARANPTLGVTNTNDSGPGSLRAAIGWANAAPGFDRIVIKATGVIHLKTALPKLRTDLAIQGPGAFQLAVADGCAPDPNDPPYCNPYYDYYPTPPIFAIADGAAVTLRDISIADGHGDGIDNSGTLTLVRTLVRDNRGAAVFNFGTLTVSQSQVRDNVRGISNYKGSAIVRQSTLTGTYGAQVLWNNAAGTMVVSQSTINGNGGRAIVNLGTARVRRTTISNSGPLDNYGGALAVAQSTLVSPGNFGAVIFNNDSNDDPNGGSITLRSTILDIGNLGCQGTVTSRGYNLSDAGTCNLTAAGDQPNTEPLLRPLDNYGGPTQTHALRPTSPAVDAGLAPNTATDQRGLARIVDYPGVPKAVGGDNSDIGAFELQSPEAALEGSVSGRR